MSTYYTIAGGTTDITSYYISTPKQIGPLTNYKENAIDISGGFLLYMFGTRKACGYQLGQTDL